MKSTQRVGVNGVILAMTHSAMQFTWKRNWNWCCVREFQDDLSRNAASSSAAAGDNDWGGPAWSAVRRSAYPGTVQWQTGYCGRDLPHHHWMSQHPLQYNRPCCWHRAAAIRRQWWETWLVRPRQNAVTRLHGNGRTWLLVWSTGKYQRCFKYLRLLIGNWQVHVGLLHLPSTLDNLRHQYSKQRRSHYWALFRHFCGI